MPVLWGRAVLCAEEGSGLDWEPPGHCWLLPNFRVFMGEHKVLSSVHRPMVLVATHILDKMKNFSILPFVRLWLFIY